MRTDGKTRYASYKPSKNQYMGVIPTHWEDRPFRDVCKIKCIQDTSGEELLSVFLDRGVVRYSDTSGKQVHKPSEDMSKYQLVEPRDLVFNNQQAWRGSVGVSRYRGIVSPAYIVMSLDDNVNDRFVNYFIRNQSCVAQFVVASKGVGSIQRILSPTKLKSSFLTLPSREEQDQIVRYLDWQTSRINKLINAKKKQIALLEEQKQGIVNAIVLGGVSENQKCKDSGVAWIGKIPNHWDAVRCKYLFSEINDRSEEGLETHLSMSQKYGLVPDSMLDERRMLSASYAGGKLCQKGDLVLNRLKAHLGVFALAPMEGVISPDYTVLRPNREYILPEFAEVVLKCTKCRPELRIRVRGIVEGFWRLYTDDFNTIYIPLPPMEEQRSIMQAIASKQEHLNKLIKAINQEIELLQEYRTRLISDVVTGQVDVRDVVIPEYEAVQELAEEEDDTFEDETEMEEE